MYSKIHAFGLTRAEANGRIDERTCLWLVKNLYYTH